jgi:hypothetical protein
MEEGDMIEIVAGHRQGRSFVGIGQELYRSA